MEIERKEEGFMWRIWEVGKRERERERERKRERERESLEYGNNGSNGIHLSWKDRKSNGKGEGEREGVHAFPNTHHQSHIKLVVQQARIVLKIMIHSTLTCL